MELILGYYRPCVPTDAGRVRMGVDYHYPALVDTHAICVLALMWSFWLMSIMPVPGQTFGDAPWCKHEKWLFAMVGQLCLARCNIVHIY